MKSDQPESFRRRAPVRIDDCGMAMAAKVLGDRWTLLIIREAFYGVRCFEDMRADLSIPSATLQKRLSQLVKNGILNLSDYQEPGERSRKAYVLSETGRALAPVILALRQWGDAALRDDAPKTELVDEDTGRPVLLTLVDPDGNPVDLEGAVLQQRKPLEDD